VQWIINLEDQRLLLSLPALVATHGNDLSVLLSVMEDTSIVALWSRKLAPPGGREYRPFWSLNITQLKSDPTSAGSTLGLSQLSQYPKE